MSIDRFKHLQTENRLIAAPKPIPQNARTHTKKQLNQIAASIANSAYQSGVGRPDERDYRRSRPRGSATSRCHSAGFRWANSAG
jgi:hypothetical protein